MVKKYFCFIILFLIVGCFVSNTMAYDDKITHPDITVKAVENSQLDSYFKNSLGLIEGIKTQFTLNNQKLNIEQWLRKGSTDEDTPNCRAANHFHDPLETWDKSYMSDDITPMALAIRAFCEATFWPYSIRKSNVTWATGYLSPAPDGQKTIFLNLYTVYNWDKARDDYYKALTSSSNSERDSYFAQTFETVGHVLHLLQDVSVPAHVRNDFQSHLIYDKFNSIDLRKNYIQPFENYVKNKPGLITAFNPESPIFLNPNLTQFWDRDYYNGSNPSATASVAIGLSEYTNANFLSDTTILKGLLDPLHSYPYPAWSSVEEYDEIDLYSFQVTTYLKKVGDGETINHLAAAKWYYKFLPSSLKNSGLYLDDKVHYDYAQKLIPRAVGYSAGLLDYFFRGEIDMIPDEATGQGGIIVNKIEENMNGTFEIYYDDVNDERKLLWSGNFVLGTLSSGNNKSNNITFTQPTDAKEVCVYILVFRGRMGYEENAVVGKVIK